MLRRVLIRSSFGQFSNKKSQMQKMYVLSQFPYPSGDLHLGHARVYYIGDAISTYYRLKNFNVIYPIGWDSFGLPAENAAILHHKNPKQWTQANIQRMKKQLLHLKINFNWQMQLSTCHPDYYRWTQQLFVKMFKKGLAYKKMAQVNWDPVDKTVLANQQVDQDGCSWRSGAKVEKRQLSQWFLKITDYAEQLQNNLGKLEWIQRVKNMQRGWIDFRKGYKANVTVHKLGSIGQSEELQMFFESELDFHTAEFIIRKSPQQDVTWKTQPDVYGYICNPWNNQPIPVIHSREQQSQFYHLVTQSKIKQNQHYRQLFRCIQKNMIGLNKEIQQTNNSGKTAGKKQLNSQRVNYMKIKDWLISRQRFWGCPIPIVYCQKCGVVPVPEDQLPVILPQWTNQGNPLLKEQFKKCTCPKCGNPSAQRQSDTMDTFVDSSWYYLRFMDNKNSSKIFSAKKVSQFLPVDIYIGGIQHAIMHLLYARFIMRFIGREYDLPSACLEPFKELVVQGLVKGRTLKVKQSGRYISQNQVDQGKFGVDEVLVTFEKMSKSKSNGLNPNVLVDKYGADALRIALFFANPPDRDIDFSQQIVLNSQKFLRRVQSMWKQLSLCNLPQQLQRADEQVNQLLTKQELLKLKNIFEKMEISIAKRLMHTYVANTMEMFNLIKQFIQQDHPNQGIFKKIKLFAIFVRVFKVIAPELSGNLKDNLMKRFGAILTSEDFNNWPSEELFGGKIEIILMKGKKMLIKDTVDMKLTDEEIEKVFRIQGKVQYIKRQKTKFIVILKD